MRVVTLEALGRLLSARTDIRRVVVSGNFAMPAAATAVLDAALPRYRFFSLNAQAGIPTREGVEHETAFVGPGMRATPGLRYVPARLSLVPELFRTRLTPDAVLVHCAPARDGRLSLGTEVNVLPAAIEQVRRRGGLVIAQVNPQMPYTFGDAQVHVDDVDLAVEWTSRCVRRAREPSTTCRGSWARESPGSCRTARRCRWDRCRARRGARRAPYPARAADLVGDDQ